MKRWQRIALLVLLVILPAGYLAVCAGLYFYQDHLVFTPIRASEEMMDREAVERKFTPWTNAQGARIGWKSSTGDPGKVLLIFHGNGEYALKRSYYRRYAAKEGDWTVYILEYPGYGARPGPPSEKALLAAALEAFDELAAAPDRKIWILGESLGTGVATAVAARRPARPEGVILITPYDRIVNVGAGRLPALPVHWLMQPRFDSVKNLENYPGPVAIVVAADDGVVPAPLGRTLFETYGGRKHLWLLPGFDHDVSGFLKKGGWAEIVQWLQGGGA